jgi:hypothetical protein
MELFDININRFGDLNTCQHISLSLSLLSESDDLSLFSLKQGLKNNKNKLLNQN